MQILASTIALLAALTAAAPSKLVSRQVPTKPCSHLTGGVHVIAGPGEGSADPPYGLIGSLVMDILAAIPGSTNVSVPYDHSQTNGQIQTDQLTQTMNSYISQYHQSCPNTKMVLVGYSSGGIGVMNVLCGYNYGAATGPLSLSEYGNYVIAAITYGEETRTAGKYYDKGTCTGVGLHPRPNPAGCNPWAGRIRGYCNKEDPNCCATTGTDMEAHYEYPQEYDQIATNYVVSQFKKRGA